jgi:plasmid stabilization system protein ParE
VPRLIWSPEALLDTQRLYRFLAAKSSDAAKRAVKVIREEVNILATSPGIGRPAVEMDHEFREWLVDFGDSGGYIVLYRYDVEAAVIVAIRHQKEVGY